MRKSKIFLLVSTLLNVALIFILVKNSQRSVITELSNDLSTTPIPNTTFENGGEVIGSETENLPLAKVTKVIDGDTIRLEDGETVRYIGIDTPEVSYGKECYADEAANKNRGLVLGKEVRLGKDVSERDRYGRLLRYVYVGNILVNKLMIYEGYATAVTYPPDVKFSELFRETEKDAREHNRGLWSKCESLP